ncbi:hypothetical protein [Pseudolysinimonas sp.]|uniref:hypothetical protein n=1 Tax=Pseudolysinimonas sp. TaxID=2680009 RepID=UPI003F804DA4
MARPTDPEPGDDDLDAEALTWAGDEEQGRARPRLAEPDADAVSTLEAAGDDDEALDEDDGPAPDVAGNVAIALFGILYLAVTVGWIYSVQLATTPPGGFPGPVVWQFGTFTAIIGAPVWFGAVVALTRGRIGLRLGWFALGLGLLLPWPVILELAG